MIFGPSGAEDLGIAEGRPVGPIDLAFLAAIGAEVDAFHTTATTACGRDDGPRGLRPPNHPACCAAYVIDPDDNNIEAEFHDR